MRMLFIFFCFVLAGACSQVQPVEAELRTPVYPIAYDRVLIDADTNALISAESEPVASAQVKEGFANDWSYTHGVVLSAFRYIDQTLGGDSYFRHNREYFDFIVDSLPYLRKQQDAFGYREKIPTLDRILNFHALDDCGSIGAALIKTYLATKNERYLPLINRVDEHVSKGQFRFADGTLARHRPQYESIWADDLYMSVPFLTNMAVLTGEARYFDDAARQLLQMAERLYVPEKGVFDHGWSVTSGDHDPRFYWARANGWTLMAMAELLDNLPENHKDRDALIKLYRSLVASLAHLQDGTGFWHNLLDKPNTFTETSATAMFTFAIAKGINEGWISQVYGSVALTGWNATSTRIKSNGAVEGTVEGTTFAHDNTYYFYRGTSTKATHGYGPVLYAGIEMVKLLDNAELEVKKARPNAINSTFHFLKKSEWPK